MIPDNYEVWAQHDAGQQAWEKSRPVCDCCREHIQDESYHRVGKSNICDSCLSEMIVYID